MEHIGFPSIEQFRNTCFDVSRRATYTGKDANGDPTYDENLPKPTLVFTGTVKLHGTNASVCLSDDGTEFWAQSRENIITPQQDNAGFARFVDERKDVFKGLLNSLKERIFSEDGVLVIYGEWCGGSIQKGVGISNLPKSFVIFGAALVYKDSIGTEIKSWIPSNDLRSPENGIYNIEDYAKYEVTIDFNNPGEQSAYMQELTAAVEAECPVAKAFGFSGIGEGIVWKAFWINGAYPFSPGELFIFKVKGDKHAVTKVKNAASATVEVMAGVTEFVDATVTEVRFNQAIEKVCGGVAGADTRKMGDYLRWMAEDIQKEETDTLTASGLTFKDVGKAINERARQMFLKLMQS